MSNIGKASANIKKKLSLQDYDSQPEQPTGALVDQQAITQVNQLTGRQVAQPASVQAEQYVDESAQRIVGRLSKKGDVKTKATFYLGKQEKNMLMQMYIAQLKKYGKADKSAMVCEAIRMLYEREK